MQLDVTAEELVAFLKEKGCSVHFPPNVRIYSRFAWIELKGGHTATVSLDDDGELWYEVIRADVEVEPFTYHDLLLIHLAVEKYVDLLAKLHNQVIGKDKEVARETADQLNNYRPLVAKLDNHLRKERSEQYGEEAEENAKGKP
jgi:hypothetical protein